MLGIVVAIMLLFSALLLIFKDNIKSYAIQEVNTYLNKKVDVGFIDVTIWSSFPNMSIDFENVYIASQFNEETTIDTALYAKNISLKFNPLDFLKGDYTVHRIDVNDAQFNMVIREDGKINYDFIQTSADSVKEDSNFDFELSKVQLKNTDFNYRNALTSQRYAMNFRELFFSGKFNQDQFDMEINTDLHLDYLYSGNFKILSNKNAQLKTELAIDQTQQLFQITSAALQINQLPFLIDGEIAHEQMRFNIQSNKISLAELTNNFTWQELDVIRAFQGSGMVDFNLTIEGGVSNEEMPAIDASFNIENGSIKDNQIEITDIFLNGIYTNGVKGSSEKVILEKVRFNNDESRFEGDLTISNFNNPRFMGKMNGALNLAAIHKLFGPFDMDLLTGNVSLSSNFDVQMLNPKHAPSQLKIHDLRCNASLNQVLMHATGLSFPLTLTSGEIVLRNDDAVIKNLDGFIDATSFELSGSFEQIVPYFQMDKTLKMQATANFGELNLDLLNSHSTSISSENRRSWLLPHRIDGDISFSASSIRFEGHTYQNTATRLKITPQQLRFTQLTAQNAGTSVRGNLSLEEYSPMRLKIVTNLVANQIDFIPLFNEWNNFGQDMIAAENISGVANTKIAFQGKYDFFKQLIDEESIIASVKVNIQDGALKNIAFFSEIVESLNDPKTKIVLNQRDLAQLEHNLKNLAFSDFEQQFNIQNRVVTIPQLTINSNVMDLNLMGSHNFDNQINYAMNFNLRDLKSKKKSEFGEIIDDGSGLQVFLKMTGDFFDPSFSWDTASRKAVKAAERETAKEEFKSIVKGGLGWNKKDSTIQEYKTPDQPKESVIIQFEQDEEEEEPFIPEKKKSKWQEKMEKLKKENQEEIEIDWD